MAIMLITFLYIVHFTKGSTLPDLTLIKFASVIGETGSIYEVNITVKHSTFSKHDAFSVIVTDQVYDMHITNLTVTPSNLNSTTQISGNVNQSIVGVLPYLRLNTSATIVYRAMFAEDLEPAESRSKATVIWFSHLGPGAPKFGPVNSSETCAQKQIIRKQLFSGEHTHLILGGIAGAVVGVFVALGLLCCINKCPTVRHHFIHTGSQKKTIDVSLSDLPPYSYDYSELKSDSSDDEDEGMCIKLANTIPFLKIVDDDDVDPALQPTDDMMWKSAIFRGDIHHAHRGLKSHYLQDYIALLEFALRMWIALWRLILAHHIDKLYRDEQITWQRKNKFIERLNTLFTDNFELPKVDNVKDYLHLSKEMILRTFNKGNQFHDNVLTDVRQGERKRSVRRCKDPAQLSKAAKYWERIKASYKRSLFNDFGNLFRKYVETLHYVSSIYFTVRLTATSTGLLFVILERSVTLVQKWLKTTMLKFMDMLKRKRQLSDNIEESFQRVFTKELKQCIEEILTRKKSIIEAEETKSISLYLSQMLSLKDKYTKLMILQSYLSISSNEDVKSEIVPPHKIIDKFSICSQYAHASEVAAQNASLQFARYSHTLLLDGIKQPLNTFITRMKHHVDCIFNEEGSRVNQGSKYEVILENTFEQMSGILSNMDLKFVEIFTRLTDILNENLGTVEESGLEFQLFYNGLVKKRKDNLPFLVKKIQLLFKCLVQCHVPMSYTKILRQIEKAPTSCISACCEQNMYIGLFDEYDFSNLVKKCASKNFLILISSIMKKFEVLNDGIIEEVMDNHDAAMRFVNDFEPNLTTMIKPFQAKTFLNLYQKTKYFRYREMTLHITCTFLTSIISSIEGHSDSNDKELIETLIDFVDKVNKLTDPGDTESEEAYTLADGMLDASKIGGTINISIQHGAINPNLLEDEVDDIDDVMPALEKYTSICENLLPENEELDNQVKADISVLNFDSDEVDQHLEAIGSQHDFLGDTSIMAADIMRESWEVIHMLWMKSFISREQIYAYLRDLTYFSHDDFHSASKKILESKIHIRDIVRVMMITAGKKKAKKLWGKVSNALVATSKLNQVASTFERLVLR